MWAAEMEETKKAIAPKELLGKMIFPNKGKAELVYGDGFQSLLGKRPPCDRWFLFGECNFGKECRFAHDPVVAPSDKMVKGLHQRLKTRLAEVVEEQKN
jgi:Zinc finger C-x8-C-x5-C-x3-H type (and similar)